MNFDLRSNFKPLTAVPSALIAAGSVDGVQVDCAQGHSVGFYFNVGAITGTVDAKLQYTDTDDATWIDDDGKSGNDTALTQITATGDAVLFVSVPRGKYARVVVTVGGTEAQVCVISLIGPLYDVEAQ